MCGQRSITTPSGDEGRLAVADHQLAMIAPADSMEVARSEGAEGSDGHAQLPEPDADGETEGHERPDAVDDHPHADSGGGTFAKSLGEKVASPIIAEDELLNFHGSLGRGYGAEDRWEGVGAVAQKREAVAWPKLYRIGAGLPQRTPEGFHMQWPARSFAQASALPLAFVLGGGE